MPVRYATKNGNWSDETVWNTVGPGPVTYTGIPTASDDVFTNTFTVNIDQSFQVNSLNNFGRGRDIATPPMTSNSTPSGVAAASSVGARQPFTSFDRGYSSNNTGWVSAAGVTTAWLSYDFGVGNEKIITGYTIYSLATQNLNFATWSFQGSNDDSTWTTIESPSRPGGIAGGATYSNTSLPNTTAYRYYRVSGSGGGGTTVGIVELELYESGSFTTTAGGTFNFNSGSISGSVTGATPLSWGATNLLTFTHNTGNVTASFNNNIIYNNLLIPGILYSGNGDLTINVPNLGAAIGNTSTFMNKTGAGTLILNGNINGNTIVSFSAQTRYIINSTNGNVIVNGNVSGPLLSSTNSPNTSITQTAGNLTINGNVTPPGVYATATQTINMSGGTSLTINGQLLPGVGWTLNTAIPTTINGNVNGTTGTGANPGAISTSNTLTINGNLYGINAGTPIYTVSTNTINVSGSIFAQSGYGVYSQTNAATINITGSVYAGQYPAVAVLGGGTVNLTGGNIYNFRRTNAIWSPNLFIDSTVTTWQLNSSIDETKTLYVSGTFPNLPAISNVRNGSAYGPDNTLVGTMLVPSPTDVRSGVAVDATTGSAQLNAADIISAINASNDPLAIRLKSILTDTTAGSLMSQYNNV